MQPAERLIGKAGKPYHARSEMLMYERYKVHECLDGRRRIRRRAAQDSLRQLSPPPASTHAQHDGREHDPQFLVSNTSRAQYRQPFHSLRTADRVVQPEPPAKRHARYGHAIDRKAAQHVVEPQAMRIRSKRRPRRCAETSLADHIDCVDAEAAGERANLADPHSAVS